MNTNGKYTAAIIAHFIDEIRKASKQETPNKLIELITAYDAEELSNFLEIKVDITLSLKQTQQINTIGIASVWLSNKQAILKTLEAISEEKTNLKDRDFKQDTQTLEIEKNKLIVKNTIKQLYLWKSEDKNSKFLECLDSTIRGYQLQDWFTLRLSKYIRESSSYQTDIGHCDKVTSQLIQLSIALQQ